MKFFENMESDGWEMVSTRLTGVDMFYKPTGFRYEALTQDEIRQLRKVGVYVEKGLVFKAFSKTKKSKPSRGNQNLYSSFSIKLDDKLIYVYKTEDEWFYVNIIYYGYSTLAKCDQMYGLLNYLSYNGVTKSKKVKNR